MSAIKPTETVGIARTGGCFDRKIKKTVSEICQKNWQLPLCLEELARVCSWLASASLFKVSIALTEGKWNLVYRDLGCSE